MTRYALLILPSANRVYTEAATSLTAAELAAFSDSVLSGALSAAEVTRRGGVPYLEFEADQLRPEHCAFLEGISSLYALFEVTGALLSPVELTRLDHYDDDLITIQKYQGRTNEQFTKLLLNVTLLASAVGVWATLLRPAVLLVSPGTRSWRRALRPMPCWRPPDSSQSSRRHTCASGIG